MLAVSRSSSPRGARVRWHLVAGRPIRSLVLGAPTDLPPLVLVPGLGALGYLWPTVRACAAWTQVHLLDLPGFGHVATAALPADLDAVSRAVTGWLAGAPGPVLLVGHSTGAQAALRAAVARPAGVQTLVLAGATFPPEVRPPSRLLPAVARTLLHEHPWELPAVLPYYLRGASGLGPLLRSALSDRPEDAVGHLRVPLHVLHGRHDRLCPPSWAAQLASSAPAGRAVALPGAHNTVSTHPVETAAALRGCA